MGPETQLGRYADVRHKSGVQDKTYRAVLDDIEKTNRQANAEVDPEPSQNAAAEPNTHAT